MSHIKKNSGEVSAFLFFFHVIYPMDISKICQFFCNLNFLRVSETNVFSETNLYELLSRFQFNVICKIALNQRLIYSSECSPLASKFAVHE